LDCVIWLKAAFGNALFGNALFGNTYSGVMSHTSGEWGLLSEVSRGFSYLSPYIRQLM
jgi:hypothetical protein